jgi:hypothetical protein
VPAGTPADQFVTVNQLFEVAPVQSVACDGVVIANASPSAAIDVAPSRPRRIGSAGL